MAHRVIMPRTGMAMEEGTIVRWLKKPGDPVVVGEPIAEIETDKVTMDLESDFEGTLLGVVHADGEVVKATHTIAWIGAPGESFGDETPVAVSPEAGPAAGSAPALAPAPAMAADGPLRATPAARRLAAESGISLAAVAGTGPGGAARARDVQAARAAGTGAGTAMTGMRRLIAERMLRSHREIPSVTLVTRADVTELVDLRARANAAGTARLSYTDFIVRAAATALREHPLINSIIQDHRIVPRERINIGIAVALDAGLIVPVLHEADRLGLRQISDRARDLAARARAGKLSPDDCAGGTFTVTNLGMYGITEFTPLINLPESAILGVGAIEETFRTCNGRIESRRVMSLCLTHDHRHIDGAPAAAFLRRIRTLLEDCFLLIA